MVPVPVYDMRRLDLVVTESSIFRRLPLLCDVFCVSPITGAGSARSGCIMNDGGAVRAASTKCHDTDYPEVDESGIARLCALGVETFGRWSTDAITVVKSLATERCASLPHRVQRGTEQRLLRRWWGVLGMATQRMIARSIYENRSADLPTEICEPNPFFAD